jgi:hypothetical protein
MLHLLDAGFDNDGSGRNHRTRKMKAGRPASKAAHEGDQQRISDNVTFSDRLPRIV